MEYYSAIKKKIHATLWMDLENILNQSTPTQKDKYYMTPLI
jgi:hypothetical protein